MNILVTGAAGFIGSNLSCKLLELGHPVFMVDRFSDYYSKSYKIDRASKLNLIQNIYDLDLNIPSILDVFKDSNIEAVVHLAAQPGIRVSYPKNLNYLFDNINSHNNILNWALNNGVKKFFYASSSSVYEFATTIPFDESESLNAPTNLYPFSKWVNERISNEFSENSEMYISGLRFFSVYGPYGRPDMAIQRLIEAAYSQNDFYLNGNGDIERDFTFVDDVSDRIISLLKFDCPLENIYNIGGGSSVSMNSLIEIVEKTVGKRISVKSRPQHEFDLRLTLADNSRINSVHGNDYWTPISQGIDETVKWFSSV